MTKQPSSATIVPPSRLCRILLLLLALKLLVLGALCIHSPLPATDAEAGSFARIAALLPTGSVSANAATGESAGAPPPLDAVLPDAQMLRPLPGVPEQKTPAASASQAGNNGPPSPLPPQPGLPPIDASPSPAISGSANGSMAVDRDSLARRLESLGRKEQELRVLESELHKKLEEMRMLENRIAVMMKEAEETQDAKFRHLVDVLSSMKSKQAATVLETLDPRVAVKVLAGMRGRQAGEILTFVKAERAAQLTESLARMQLPLE